MDSSWPLWKSSSCCCHLQSLLCWELSETLWSWLSFWNITVYWDFVERQCYEPWPKYCITSMQQSAVLQGVHTESYNVDDGSIDSIIKQQMLSRCGYVGACSGCSLRWRLNYCDNALHSSSPTSHWSVTLSTLYSTHHSKAQVDIIISLTLALFVFVCCRKYSNIPHK